MTTTTTLPDTDLQTLQDNYTIDDAWWAEARIIADAIVAEETPRICSIKPWSTIATYMALNSDPQAALNKYLGGLRFHMRLAISTALSAVLQEAIAATTTQSQQGQKKHKPTDDELRDRWRNRNQDVAFGMGDWRAYDTGLWPIVDDAIVQRQIMGVLEDAKYEGIRPTSNLMRSVLELSRIAVFQPAEVWDADPNLLVCTNGMLHISSKTLRPHSKDAYLTTGVPYAYDPQAGCPVFLDALTRLPYRVVQFLQEFAGYCLTTDTLYEIGVWLLGVRGSGKSTIIEGFNAMLGDRAGVLSLKQISQSRFGLSNIDGKTLIYAFESPALYVETTDILNAIVSGEAIPVERKYRDPVTVIPRAKILWAMNKLPRIADAGDGIFRRARIVQFAPLPETDKDPRVKDAIKLEGPGILNWGLAGLDRLRNRGGFLIPPEVKAATDGFQAGNDPEAAFIAECCDADISYKVQATPLYKAYRQWCFNNGHKPKSSTNVAQEWPRLGFFRTRQQGSTYYLGLDIKLQYQVP